MVAKFVVVLAPVQTPRNSWSVMPVNTDDMRSTGTRTRSHANFASSADSALSLRSALSSTVSDGMLAPFRAVRTASIACGCTPLPTSSPHVPRGGFGAGVAAGWTAGASDAGVAAGSTAGGSPLSACAPSGVSAISGAAAIGATVERFTTVSLNRAGAAGEQDHGQE